MDAAVTEEYIEYYMHRYNQLLKTTKFTMPVCQNIDHEELINGIEKTFSIPSGYYITAECNRDVENFGKEIFTKFGHIDGPFCSDETIIEIFLHKIEHF